MPPLHDHRAVLRYLSDAARTGALSPGAVLFLLGNEQGLPPVAVMIEDVPPSPPQHERVRLIAAMLSSLAEVGCSAFVVIVCRSGSALVTGDDLAWHDAAYGVRQPDAPACQGVYVAARGRVLRVAPEAPGRPADEWSARPEAEAG